MQFYPFGLSESDNTLPMGGDTTSGEISLLEDFIFYDEVIRSVYVSTKILFVCVVRIVEPAYSGHLHSISS